MSTAITKSDQRLITPNTASDMAKTAQNGVRSGRSQKVFYIEKSLFKFILLRNFLNTPDLLISFKKRIIERKSYLRSGQKNVPISSDLIRSPCGAS
jgi:hypothetical protein